jgi:hypothetical protein
MKYIKGFDGINESMSREGMINVIRNILRETYDLNNNANIVDVINKFSEKLFINDSDKEAFSTSIIGDMLSESIVLVDDFDRSSIKFKERFHGPTIAYSDDIENDRVSFMSGYFSGTAIIGGDNEKSRGEEDYSSPFHTGQVINSDEFEDGIEEVDFRYSRRMPSSVVRQKLEEYVSKHYNGKIIKITYH